MCVHFDVCINLLFVCTPPFSSLDVRLGDPVTKAHRPFHCFELRLCQRCGAAFDVDACGCMLVYDYPPRPLFLSLTAIVACPAL